MVFNLLNFNILLLFIQLKLIVSQYTCIEYLKKYQACY